MNEETLRNALSSSLNTVTKELCALNITNEDKILIHKLLLRLINLLLDNLKIDKKATIEKLKKKGTK